MKRNHPSSQPPGMLSRRAQLARIVAAWRNLPDFAREDILEIVETVTSNGQQCQVILAPRCPLCGSLDVQRTCSRLPTRYYRCNVCGDARTGRATRFKVIMA